MPPEASLAERRGPAEPRAAADRHDSFDLDVGDALVVPHHGVGTVVERSVRRLAGRRREYLSVELERGSMTLRIPTDTLDGARLRPLASRAELRRALKTLEAAPEALADNWISRRKDALEKIGSGELLALAEVVRDLAHLGVTKPLAVNDRELYTRARELLESELMVALELDEARAAATIDRGLPAPPNL